MSTAPPTDAELVAAFTAEADEAVTAADFMRRRANAFHGRPAPSKLRLTRLAPILAVALIIAVAAIVAVFRSTGDKTTRPSGEAGCIADFKLAVAEQLQSLPPIIGFTLTYTGSSPCAVLLAPPTVTIIDGNGRQMGVATGGPVAGHNYPRSTVHRGGELDFGISGFLGCYETPPSHYTVLVRTQTIQGTSATVQAPLTIEGKRSHRSPNHCSTSAIGDVSPLAIASHPTPTPTLGAIEGTLEAVGGPAPGRPRPLPGSVKITNIRTHDSRVVSVTADGRFSVSVTPGTYLITGRSPEYNDGTAYDCQAMHSTVVTGHRTSSTNVYCQER